MAREDFVELLQRCRVEFQVEGAQRGIELVVGAWPDDRGCYCRLVQQPGEGDVARLVAQFGTLSFGLLELRTQPLHRLRGAALEAALAFIGLADDPAQEPRMQR